jgi:hypothetical protein
MTLTGAPPNSRAICFKCGGEKDDAFVMCAACGIVPMANSDRALSLALSEHLSSKAELDQFARELRSGAKLSLQRNKLIQAILAVNDPKLKAMLSNDQQSDQVSAPQTSREQKLSGKETPRPKTGQQSSRDMTSSELHQNPFWILGATSRDDRRRIVELADERALNIDPEVCQRARSDLTNPRTRLTAELAWLPGVSPRKAEQLARQVLVDPLSVRGEAQLPILAHANLMSAAFAAVDERDLPEEVAKFIGEMATLVDRLSLDEVVRDVNEDRSVSGFPQVKSEDHVESELAERKRRFRNAIKEALNRLAPAALVGVMTQAVDTTTEGATHHAPELIDELVDSYEVETQGFLQQESTNVLKLIAATRASAKSGEESVKVLIDRLDGVVRNWSKVARPIQLSAKARGIAHKPSVELAFSIRSLGIDLFNEHEMLAQSKRITALLQDLFSDLPDVSERVDQDVEALDDIFQNRKKAEAQRDEWAREITYSTEVGMVFKDVLSISPEGIVWKGRRYPLESITRMRWGGVRHSVNGIPTGTNYTIAFGDSKSESVIELRRGPVFSTFTDKLWRAAGIRLLTEILETLKTGREIAFADALVRDGDVTLTKHRFLGANERVRCTWDQVHVWTADGSFYIGAQKDKKTYAGMSYIHVPNVHLLEQAIRVGFKKGIRKLSDTLNG